MAEETASENSRISDFEGLMTLTLDRVMLHTVAHHSSCQISLKWKKLFEDGWMDICTYARMDGHLRPALLGQLCQKVRPKNWLVWSSKGCSSHWI